jgi:hypothetical protein
MFIYKNNGRGIDAGLIYHYGYFYEVITIPLKVLFMIYSAARPRFTRHRRRNSSSSNRAMKCWNAVTHSNSDHARHCLTSLIEC